MKAKKIDKNFREISLMVRKTLFWKKYSWLFAGSFWLNLDQTIRSIGDLVIIIIIARLASQQIYGSYQLIYSLIMVASVATLTGFNGSLLRALSRGFDGTLRDVMNLSWRWSWLGVLGLISVGIYWIFNDKVSEGFALILVSWLLPSFHIYRRWQVILHAKEKFRERALKSLIVVTSTSAIVFVVSWYWSTHLGILMIAVVGMASFWNTFLFRKVQKYITSNNIEIGWRKSGYKLVLSELFGVLYAHLDKIVLAWWLGVNVLAIYSIAVLGGEALKLVLGNFIGVALPRIHRSDTQIVLRHVFKRIVWIFIALVVLISICWNILPFIIQFAFGAEYSEAVVFGQWYLLILPGHMIATFFGYLLIKDHQESSLMMSFVGAGLFNILLYLVAIPIFGTAGAVVGSIGYYIALSILMGFFLFINRVKNKELHS